MSGTLVLMVGASGVGKDAILTGLRERFGQHPGVCFPRRIITRPLVPGHETHQAVDLATFQQLMASGGIALHWYAYGHHYGLPAAIDEHLCQGHLVIATASRAGLPEAREQYPEVRIVWVEASPAAIAERLRRRRREETAGIEARLTRNRLLDRRPGGATVIVNEGPVAQAVEAASAQLLRWHPALVTLGSCPR